jgi:hypothetical protein
VVKNGNIYKTVKHSQNMVEEKSIDYLTKSGEIIQLPVFDSENIKERFSALLSQRLMPLDIGTILTQRVRAKNVSEEQYKRWNTQIDTSAGVICDITAMGSEFYPGRGRIPNLFGTFKITHTNLEILNRVPTHSNEHRIVEMTRDEFIHVEGTEFQYITPHPTRPKNHFMCPVLDDTGYKWNIRYTEEKLRERFKNGQMDLWPTLLPANSEESQSAFIEYVIKIKEGGIPGYELPTSRMGSPLPNFSILSVNYDSSPYRISTSSYGSILVGHNPNTHKLD